ncbi:hypothetical protein ANABIO4_38480 [Bacillus subtilis]|nr:hypothetical protein ANABIO4_38480 [Bacillus subtilis]
MNPFKVSFWISLVVMTLLILSHPGTDGGYVDKLIANLVFYVIMYVVSIVVIYPFCRR